MNNKSFLLLHALLMIYSLSEVFSKLAAGQPAMSLKFFVFYGLVLLILFLYAIGWQQVIRRMPLTSAFANKAVTTVWGTVWGVLLFREHVSFGNLIGIAMIIIGIVIFTKESVTGDES